MKIDIKLDNLCHTTSLYPTQSTSQIAAFAPQDASLGVRKSCDTKKIQIQPGPCLGCIQHNPIIETARFSYARTTKINNVKFAHQSFGNPPIASILKAINAGFLDGAPHLDAMTVRKYLVSSPATAKGHMKRPRKGIRSTTPNAQGKYPHFTDSAESARCDHARACSPI